MILSRVLHGSTSLTFLQIGWPQQLDRQVILCANKYYYDSLHTLQTDIFEKLVDIVFNFCIGKQLEVSSLYHVALVYSCRTTVCTNFSNGTRVSLIVYTMAFYFRDNVTFYATDEISQRLFNIIMGHAYKILLERSVENYLAHDYCEILFISLLEQKDTTEFINNKFQENGTVMQSNEISTLNQLIRLVQHFNYFVDSKIQRMNDEEILKILYKVLDDDFICYIQQMYSILAYNLDDSPNLVANKYLEMKMQSSLSVKRINKSAQQIHNRTAPSIINTSDIIKTMTNNAISRIKKSNADNHIASKNSDNDYIKTYYHYNCRQLQDCKYISSSINRENNVPAASYDTNYDKFHTEEGITLTFTPMSKIFFSNKFNRKSTIENLPLLHVHYNIADNFKFICFRLNIKETTLQHLIDNFIVFGFRLLCHYEKQDILDVVVYVYRETVNVFCTAIKRYANKCAKVVYSRFRIILGRSLIQHLGTEFLSEIKNNVPIFIKDIRDAKRNQFYLAEMFMNSCHDGYKVVLKSKRPHDLIDIYVVIEKTAFLHLCNTISFSFKIHMKVSHNQLCFLYVHIYVHKIRSLQIYQNLRQAYMIKTRMQSTNCINALNALWNCRPGVQLIYTSDYHAILDQTSTHFVRNILFNVYVIRTGKYSPFPRNLIDANTMCFLLLRIAKSIAYKQDALFHVKNDIDGPLNNIVSIRGVASIVDNKVDDHSYKCNCTTVCTMLNCPLYTGLQNPQYCKLNTLVD